MDGIFHDLVGMPAFFAMFVQRDDMAGIGGRNALENVILGRPDTEAVEFDDYVAGIGEIMGEKDISLGAGCVKLALDGESCPQGVGENYPDIAG
jgi:hypothetical protein